MPKRRGAFGTTGQTSAGSWWARYTYNATMHRPGHTFASRELADAWLSGERRLIDLDTWTPPADRRAAAKAEALMETTTLHAFATEWIAKRVTRRGEPLHPRTREDYGKYLDGMLAPLASKPVGRISAADVKRWHDSQAGAPSQRHKAYSFMKSVLKSAVSRGLIAGNPCQVENATRPPRRKHKAAEVARWLNHERVVKLADLVQPRDRLLILLCAYCCVRTGEAFALRRSDLELGVASGEPFGWLTVERGISTYDGQRHEGETKTSDLGNRTIPVPPHLLVDIEVHLGQWAAKGGDGLLFPSTNPIFGFRTASQVNGNKARRGKLGYGWYHARQVAGRPDAHLHDLRHWGATLWDEAGTPTALRIALMGHAQPGMTGQYTHPDTTKASPYALKVSQLAGWGSQASAATRVPDSQASVLTDILAALDPDGLVATLRTLSADQLTEVVSLLPSEQVAALVARSIAE